MSLTMPPIAAATRHANRAVLRRRIPPEVLELARAEGWVIEIQWHERGDRVVKRLTRERAWQLKRLRLRADLIIVESSDHCLLTAFWDV